MKPFVGGGAGQLGEVLYVKSFVGGGGAGQLGEVVYVKSFVGGGGGGYLGVYGKSFDVGAGQLA